MQNYTNEDQDFKPETQQFASEKITDLLIQDLGQSENPFSFYNQGYERSDSNQSRNSDDEAPLQDITGKPIIHKQACQTFSSKDSINQIMHQTTITPTKKATDNSQIENFVSPFSQNSLTSALKNSESTQKKTQPETDIKTPDKLSDLINRCNFLCPQHEKLSNMLTQDQQMNPALVIVEQNNCKKDSKVCEQQNQNNLIKGPESQAKISLELIASQKQLQDDMAGLKKSFQQKQKNKHSAKEMEVITASNKTMIASPIKNTKKTSINATQSQLKISNEDAKIIYKLIGSKKKQNFKALRQWDNKKNDSLDLHQSMVEIFLNEIDKRLKSSKQNYDIYCQFFRQKYQQQQKYANFTFLDTRSALKDNNVSRSLFLNCSVALNTLNQEMIARNKKIKDFVHLIKQNILKDLMDKHINQSQKEMLVLRQKISTFKNSLCKLSDQVSATNEELQKVFTDYSTPPKDFYAVQIRYLRRSGRQVAVQKKLGLLVLQFYNRAIQQDLKRSEVIRQALITYSKGLKQTYNTDIEKQEMEQLSKGQQKKLIYQFYSFEEMFQDQVVRVFKKKSQMGFKKGDQVSFQDFQRYLQNYEVQQFDGIMAILAHFDGFHKAKDSKKEQPCYIVITVDAFIHLFFNKEKKSGTVDPDISFPIFKKGVELKNLGGESVQIIKRQQRRSSVISYFWDSKQDPSYHLRFSKKEAKQEFIDIINKLTK